ncbi:MAG: hypothetical protein K0R71_1687 [Bacillales bacterium]|nr:hypothetical protein [Bacillales bacterium]
MKRYGLINIVFLVIFFSVFILAGCGIQKNLIKKTASESKLTLNLNEKVSILQYFTYETDTNGVVLGEFVSENASIVTINKKGLLRTLSVGNAAIYYEDKNGIKSNKVMVTVTAPVATIYPSITKLSVGESSKLQLVYPNIFDREKSGVWSVQDPSVVSVDQEGNIKALKPGSTQIIFSERDITKVTLATVMVLDNVSMKDNNNTGTSKNISISLDIKDLEMKVYQQHQVNVIFPKGYTGDRSGTWKSENPKFLSVDSNGLVTSKSSGGGKLVFTSSATGAVASTMIYVIPETEREKTIEKDGTVDIKVGEYLKVFLSVDGEKIPYEEWGLLLLKKQLSFL